MSCPNSFVSGWHRGCSYIVHYHIFFLILMGRYPSIEGSSFNKAVQAFKFKLPLGKILVLCESVSECLNNYTGQTVHSTPLSTMKFSKSGMLSREKACIHHSRAGVWGTPRAFQVRTCPLHRLQTADCQCW